MWQDSHYYTINNNSTAKLFYIKDEKWPPLPAALRDAAAAVGKNAMIYGGDIRKVEHKCRHCRISVNKTRAR